MAKMTPQSEDDVTLIRSFLAYQRTQLTRDRWQLAYSSWWRGGYGWNKLRSGGTDIQTCLAWYQSIHKPGSKEWRPSIIIDAVCQAAGVTPEAVATELEKP